MVIALIGSHGTGKTTVFFEEMRKQRPDLIYFSEGVRHQSPAFGYGDPEGVCEKYGVGAFGLMNMNSWSVIDPKHNTTLDQHAVVVCDRSALDNYAYYLALRNTEEDFKFEPLLAGMARHYVSLNRSFYLSLNPPRIPRSSAAWVEFAAVGNGGTMRTCK